MALFNVLFDIAAKTAGFESSMKRVEGEFKQLKTVVKDVSGALGVAFSAAALTDFIGSALKAGDTLYTMSQQTGVAVQALSELSYAAQSSGVNADALTTAFAKMQQNVVKGSAVFGELGINVDKLKELSPDQQFEAVAEAISQIPDPAERASDAIAIFGRAGAELLPLLNQGAEGIEKLRKKSEDLNAALDGATAAALHDAKSAIDDLHQSVTGLGDSLVAKIAPAISLFSNEIRLMIGSGTGIERLQAQLEKLQEALLIPGTASGTAAIKANIAQVQAQIDALNGKKSALPAGVVGNPKFVAYTGAPLPNVENLYASSNQALEASSRLYQQLNDQQNASIDQMVRANRAFLDQENADTMTGLEKQFAARDHYQSELENLVANGMKQDEANRRLAEYDNDNALGIDSLQPVVVKAQKMLTVQQQTWAAMSNLTSQASQSMANSFEQFFADPVSVGIKGLAKDFLAAVDQMLAKWTTLELFGANGTSGALGSLFDKTFSLIAGARASGGPVSAGMPYLVGEKGAELFTPSTAGTITPNSGLGTAGGINIPISIDMRGSTPDAVKLLPSMTNKAVQMALAQVLQLKRRGVLAAGPLG
ncbi:MAG TPA: hypothetical protein VN660_13695 [Steroidobacteraceae bacterium]|nr:hypothetical protein [Steroidobacteraceae bacterium]